VLSGGAGLLIVGLVQCHRFVSQVLLSAIFPILHK
jgi:hypothetical protein